MYIIQYHNIIQLLYIYVCVWLFLTNTSESYMANNRNIWWRCRVTSTAT